MKEWMDMEVGKEGKEGASEEGREEGMKEGGKGGRNWENKDEGLRHKSGCCSHEHFSILIKIRSVRL